jgi:alkyldihydroxyacetonephosphate synthase
LRQRREARERIRHSRSRNYALRYKSKGMATNPTGSQSALVRDLTRALPDLVVSEDPADRVTYARDLWPRHHLAVRAGNVAEHRPGAIAWPRSTSEVSSLVKWAAETRTPLVPFGAGSGVCGGVLPREDVVIVDLKRMSRWRSFDTNAPSLEVEAGQMGMPLEEELDRRGFTLGHFPSSILCSTVGGWVAARSAGQASGYYGKIEDMVLGLECVTGTGEVVNLRHRNSGPNLIPFVVGSEGTLAIVTSATLRLHPRPSARAFASWSLPSTEHGWEAMRAVFQAGLRPAVLRLYDPFDAMLARQGAVKRAQKKKAAAPGMGQAALRRVLRRPNAMNELVELAGTRVLGGALLVAIFDGEGDAPAHDQERARAIVEATGAKYEGEGAARRWLQHRYSVSYRQAPIFASGAFVDTMEVAATWSRLGALYDGVRKAVSPSAFIMAHFSHAYPDGCCIYFSFAGSADRRTKGGWDAACEATYDRTWRAALDAAIAAGGTLAHHHGVGRSKAPRLAEELGGAGISVVRALQRAFDPHGILNPGNLLPPPNPPPFVDDAHPREVLS